MTQRRRLARWLTVFTVLAFMATHVEDASAKSRTFYVRTRGNDSAAGTNRRVAWKTLRRAAQIARSGDTVHIGAGTYAEGSIWWNRSVRVLGDTSGRFTGDRGMVRVHAGNQWSMGFYRGGSPVMKT